MSLTQNTNNKYLEIAKTTQNSKILDELKSNTNNLVRRAVARNAKTSIETLSILAYDPVLNVSYMAVNNPKCNQKRDFSKIYHPCVICTKDERNISCTNCQEFKKYSFSYEESINYLRK